MPKAKSPSIGSSCPEFARERLLLIATLDGFNDDEMDYRPPAPAPVSPLSVREIFLHIVDSDDRLISGAMGGKAYASPSFLCDESVATIFRIREQSPDRNGIRARLLQSWKLVEGILAWPVEALQRNYTPESAFSLLTALGHALDHAAKHRGQLNVYLELLGRTPPAED